MKAARQSRHNHKDDRLIQNLSRGTLGEDHEDRPSVVFSRKALLSHETTEFICGACMKGGFCMKCMEVALEPEVTFQSKANQSSTVVAAGDSLVTSSIDEDKGRNVGMANSINNVKYDPGEASHRKSFRELFFRCLTCKRLAHCVSQPTMASYCIF
jgi:hypothetical protein